MLPKRIVDERAFADTEEVPIVADPDLCDEEPRSEMPETVREGSVFRSLGAGDRRGNLVVE